jgi:putative restriction endonuclease
MRASALHDHWLTVAANLRVDRSRGVAPHKPLLLLVVADLVEVGELSDPLLPLTGELTFRFMAYWSIVAHRRSQRPDIRLPFFHLSGDGCWTPLDRNRQRTSDRRAPQFAQLDPDFFECLNTATFRKHLRHILVATYFPDPGESSALYDLLGFPTPSTHTLKEDAAAYIVSRQRGREARFRLTVVPAYAYTCALTRYRCVTVDAGSIVDACHIHPFSDSRNNHPRNGIALSKNAHWLFDQGLWSLTDDYEVMVAKDRFDEAGEDAWLLQRMAGTRIQLPADKRLWPDPAHIAWHRTRKFVQ